jgi:hypothetical protein
MSFKSIGALWTKEGNKGKYLSGNIELNGHKLNISIFRNDKAEGKKPDYKINADETTLAEFISAFGAKDSAGATFKTPTTGSDFAELEDDGDLPF